MAKTVIVDWHAKKDERPEGSNRRCLTFISYGEVAVTSFFGSFGPACFFT